MVKPNDILTIIDSCPTLISKYGNETNTNKSIIYSMTTSLYALIVIKNDLVIKPEENAKPINMILIAMSESKYLGNRYSRTNGIKNHPNNENGRIQSGIIRLIFFR